MITSNKVVEIFKNLIGVSATVYIIGFYIVNTHLTQYGIIEISIAEISYLISGLSFFIPFLVFVLIILLFKGSSAGVVIKNVVLIFTFLFLIKFLTIEYYREKFPRNEYYDLIGNKDILFCFLYYFIIILLSLLPRINLLKKIFRREVSPIFKIFNNKIVRFTYLYIPVFICLGIFDLYNLRFYENGLYFLSIFIFLNFLLRFYQNNKKQYKLIVSVIIGTIIFSYWYGSNVYTYIRSDFGGGEMPSISFLIKADNEKIVSEMEKIMENSQEVSEHEIYLEKSAMDSHQDSLKHTNDTSVIYKNKLVKHQLYKTKKFTLVFQTEDKYFLWLPETEFIMYSLNKELVFSEVFNKDSTNNRKTRDYFKHYIPHFLNKDTLNKKKEQ